MARPGTKVELQQFLGCINFYHRFIPHLAAKLAPLHSLVASVSTQSAVLRWNQAQDDSFGEAKSALAEAAMLRHPSTDPNAQFSLTTDASGIAVGAVLSQTDSERPLAFFSKKLSEAEKKYSTFDRELLAIFLAIRNFRHYLEGRSFKIWTDHKPLCGAFASSAERSPRQTRHLSFIAEFLRMLITLPEKKTTSRTP